MKLYSPKDCRCKPKLQNIPLIIYPTNREIVTGPTGPTGPTGNTGATGPTGSVYPINTVLYAQDGIQTVTSNSLVNLGVLINQTGTGIIAVDNNTLEITEIGSYYLIFSGLIANSSSSGDVGASLLINNTVIDNASIYKSASNIQSEFVLQHSFIAVTGTTIEIKNSSSVSNLYHDISLFVVKIA